MAKLHIGIVGGGIGGLAAAIALARQGHRVSVCEQAGRFARVGADINLTPNAVRALDGLGQAIGQAVRNRGARPTNRISRDWDTGKETSRLGMSDVAEKQYGAPQITIHRADVLAALTDALDTSTLTFGKRLTTLSDTDADAGVVLRFDNGSTDIAVDLLQHGYPRRHRGA